MTKLQERFEDYVISYDPSPYFMDFDVAAIVAEDEHGTAFFTRKGADSSLDETHDFADAEPVLSGSVKWDGCSNIDFHTDKCLAHFCGRKDVLQFAALLNRLYDIASANIEKYDVELADGRADG